jgi:UDP-glucose 4-epimerase
MKLINNIKYKMNKILITGAGGYVGTELCNYLAKKNYHITAVDTFWFGDKLDSNIKKIKVDIRNIDSKIFKIKIPFRYGRVMCKVLGMKTIQEMKKDEIIDVEFTKKSWNGLEHLILVSIKEC